MAAEDMLDPNRDLHRFTSAGGDDFRYYTASTCMQMQ
jgi:hypothetical protein